MASNGVGAKSVRACLAIIVAIAMNTVSIPVGQAATLNQALLRLDRLQTGVATSFMATFRVNQASGVSKIRLTLPSGFSIGSLSVSTAGLDPGITPLPGSLTISASGQSITISGVDALTTGITYGFTGSSITNPATGAYEAQLSTLTSGNTVIEQTTVAIPILANDQIGITSFVPICPKADFNHDRKVNIFDLSALLTRYGTNNSIGDMNGDGRVNIFDLSIFLNCFGYTY